MTRPANWVSPPTKSELWGKWVKEKIEYQWALRFQHQNLVRSSKTLIVLQSFPLGLIGRAQPQRAVLLGRGVMVAQRTLNPFILVRIRAPQPDFEYCDYPVSDEDPHSPPTSSHARYGISYEKRGGAHHFLETTPPSAWQRANRSAVGIAWDLFDKRRGGTVLPRSSPRRFVVRSSCQFL